MQNFDYQTPTRLIFGKGVVEQLPEVMAQFGKRILLTYGGGSIKKIGLYQKVLEAGAPDLVVVSLVVACVQVAEVRRRREEGCDEKGKRAFDGSLDNRRAVDHGVVLRRRGTSPDGD